jgi:hypothetical protein
MTMPNAKDRAAEKIRKNLFKPTSEVREQFSEMEMERKKRIMLAVTMKLDDPITPDKEVINFLVGGCGDAALPVSQSTAYRDLRLINSITGNIQLASKDWDRYMVVETAKQQIGKFKDKDGKAVAALLKVIVQARRLDQDDPVDMFDKMVPFDPEITSDAKVLGEGVEVINDVENRRKELRDYFGKHSTTVTEFEELKDE